ncbi:helix-turn-helix domain-containing protein (plasmid) [Limosilactobacillus reuteri]|uniref:helix-turn-helix transcriptional regulator n=1 Tax=Limosilactobacillus reuteri TaxID=1598 RepID=UPI003D817DEE
MVNNQIKKLRIEKGLSQGQLAEKANVSIRTIQQLEAGNDVSISTLSLIAGALGVEVKKLFDAEVFSQQQERLNFADNQLKYQLHERRREYSTYSQLHL